MSRTTRNAIQLVALILCVAVPFLLYGWVGALIGLGVYLVGTIAWAVILMRKTFTIGNQPEQDIESTIAPATTSTTGNADELTASQQARLRRPTRDHKKKA